MTAIEILGLVIKASLFMVVLGFGMQASLRDVTFLLRRPAQLIASIVSINVIMPILGILVAKIFELDHVIEVALVALAAAPIPPILPNKAMKSEGDKSFSFGLLVTVSFLSLFVIPAVVKIAGWVFEKQTFFAEASIVLTILTGVVIPMAIGMLINRFAPGFAERVSGILGKVGFILLIIACLPILISLFPSIWHLIGNWTVAVLVVFAICGIAVGHLLGGSDPHERTVLALATASRHPGIAIGLTVANLGDADKSLGIAAVLLYFIVSAIAVIPYLKWMSGRIKQEEGALA